MNPRSFLIFLSGLAALLLAGCDTDQGPAQIASTQPATQMGKPIEPAPESKSFPTKKDVFQGAEYDPGTGAMPAGARQLNLRLGQVIEVFHGNFAPTDGQRELAFYLPEEARSVVQLVVESSGFKRTYFLRAIGLGQTVGGVVERRWLDASGNNPKSVADEARIQSAVRAAPYLISVNN